MSDLEKIIGELEYCRNNQKCNDCEKCQRGGRGIVTCESLVDDTLNLLKEQEEKMKHLNNIILEYEKEVFRLQTLLKEQETKTGHWIDTTNTIGFPRCECSECNSEAGAIWMKYCPNCGAKMEGR